MASGNVMYVLIIFVICLYTKSVCDSLGIADTMGNSTAESDAFTETLDDVPSIAPYVLPKGLERINYEDRNKNLNTYNDGITADQQTVMDIVQKQLNSILRGKRMKCTIPNYMFQDLTRIYRMLNNSVFFTAAQDDSPRVRIPHIQLQTCPADRENLPLESEINSLAVCPWRIIERDLGMFAFPRYMHDIECLCQECPRAKSLSCAENRHSHEYLTYRGCESGFTVFARKYATVGYDCFCRSASFQKIIPNRNDE